MSDKELSPLGSGNVTPTYDPNRATTNMLVTACWALSPDDRTRASFSSIQRIMERAGEPRSKINIALVESLLDGLSNGNWPTVSD